MSSSVEWACSACTFLNAVTNFACAVCEAPRATCKDKEPDVGSAPARARAAVESDSDGETSFDACQVLVERFARQLGPRSFECTLCEGRYSTAMLTQAHMWKAHRDGRSANSGSTHQKRAARVLEPVDEYDTFSSDEQLTPQPRRTRKSRKAALAGEERRRQDELTVRETRRLLDADDPRPAGKRPRKQSSRTPGQQTAPSLPPVELEEEEMSEYERQRQENIERNRAVMLSLGLGS